MNQNLRDILNSNQATVMIVDDEEMVTQTLASYLQLETEYKVLTFQSPTEAIKALQENPVDLVISDFLMPEMDGLRFLSEVKKLHPQVNRILLTGYADKENAIKAINDVGLYQYIEKPWDNDYLKLVIRNGISDKNLKQILVEKISELDEVLLERDELSLHNEMLKEELLLARNVQESLLPQSLPKVDRFSFVAKYLPALEIGGDFYDIIPLKNNQVGIFVADVTGHGIQAALITVLLKSEFSKFKGSVTTPREILSTMNILLYKILPKNFYVAGLVLMLDTQTGECRLVNAGVPHPYLIKTKDNEVTRIPANGLILGIADEEIYQAGEELTFQLKARDRLILYTDGLSEVEDDRERHFETKMPRILASDCQKSSADIIEQLIRSAREYSKPEHKWDDVTVFGIECHQ